MAIIEQDPSLSAEPVDYSVEGNKHILIIHPEKQDIADAIEREHALAEKLRTQQRPEIPFSAKFFGAAVLTGAAVFLTDTFVQEAPLMISSLQQFSTLDLREIATHGIKAVGAVFVGGAIGTATYVGISSEVQK